MESSLEAGVMRMMEFLSIAVVNKGNRSRVVAVEMEESLPLAVVREV